MNIKEALVFKRPGKIDWEATDAQLGKLVDRDYPDSRPSEKAMNHASTMISLRKTVRKVGAMNLWAAIEAAKKQDAEAQDKPKLKEIHGVLRINLGDISKE